MKSAVATIKNAFDPKETAQALWREIIHKVNPEKESIGILFSDPECAPDELSKELRKLSGADILGATTVANMDRINGYSELSATLLFLTGEDISFCAGVSGSLNEKTAGTAVLQAYKKSGKAAEVPKMILLFMNAISGSVTDAVVEMLSKESGKAPVFGGLPTAFENDACVFINGEKYSDKAIVVNIYGNIHPLFLVKNVTSDYFGRKFHATKAKGRIIYEVDNKPFTEYLKGLGVDVSSAATDPNGVFFQSNPIHIEQQTEKGDAVSYTRVIEDVILQDGSATIYSNISEEATLSIVSLRMENIQASSIMLGKEMTKMVTENNSRGYEYSAAICISCYGRYLIAASQHDVEANALKQALPESLNMAGFYSYGEICPVTVGENNNNIVHNCSITLCVF